MTYQTNLDIKPDVQAVFDPATNTISYVVKDPASNACAIVDSVMDIDYAAGRISYDHADELIDYVQKNDLRLEWLIETHVHADHLSAAPYIQAKLGGKLGIGKNITIVQDTFGKVFNEGTEFQRDGSQFDALFDEGDGIDFEAVAASQPDVILAAYSGLSQADYTTLSQIAPVVAYPEGPWATDWRS